MNKILSADAREQYIKGGGVKCPFCGSEDIEGGPIEIEAGSAWQEINCHGCAEAWQDVYCLTQIEPGKYGEWRHAGQPRTPNA